LIDGNLPKPQLSEPSVMSIKFTINGRAIEVDVPVDTPLLWVVRDELDLKGTKFGCGIGLCGACTVHVEGSAQRSCIIPVSAVADKQITTIEGLDAKGQHPLQKAWVEAQAPQCGYCQSGQIMQAATLLAQNPDPTDAEIVAGMNGNLCRCMTYGRIKSAVKIAAKEMKGGRENV
jgi:isoquinoline 1-oxidoreductase alpha subunit